MGVWCSGNITVSKTVAGSSILSAPVCLRWVAWFGGRAVRGYLAEHVKALGLSILCDGCRELRYRRVDRLFRRALVLTTWPLPLSFAVDWAFFLL